MTGPATLAVDLGGTNIRAALVAPDGRILTRTRRATPAREGADAVVAAIAEACEAIATETGTTADAPVALCAPGPLDVATGRTAGTPTIAGFADFPLAAMLSARLGRPVRLENDGHAAAMGEWRLGAARGETDFAFVTISTGIGGAAVSGGRLVRGRRGLAGHFGHLPVGGAGDACFCGRDGCWEATASGSALQRRAREAGFADLNDAALRSAAGEAEAEDFMDVAARDLARGLAAIVHVFSPDAIVLGGGVMNQFDALAPRMARHLDAAVLPAFRGVALRRARLGDDAGLVGMAVLGANGASGAP